MSEGSKSRHRQRLSRPSKLKQLIQRGLVREPPSASAVGNILLSQITSLVYFSPAGKRSFCVVPGAAQLVTLLIKTHESKLRKICPNLRPFLKWPAIFCIL